MPELTVYFPEVRNSYNKIKIFNKNMDSNELLPSTKLEELIEESNQIQSRLSQRNDFLEKTFEGIATENERLEKITKEIPILIQDLSKEDGGYSQQEEIIKSLEASIRNKTNGKEKILDKIKKLQSVELPQQETKLKEIQEQIKSAQPELRHRLNTLDKITLEITSKNEKLNTLLKQSQTLEDSLLEYRTVYHEVLEEIKSLDNRLSDKTKEKDKILDTIKKLQSDEIPRQEVKLREIKSQIELIQPDLHQRQDALDKITQEITTVDKKHQELLMEIQTLTYKQQEMTAIYDGLPKEKASLDVLLITRTQEKQGILDKIKNLESVELPQQESNLNEIREQIRQLQSEINKKQEPLAKMSQEIPQELQKLKELERKEDILKKEYHSAEAKRQELTENLANLEEIIEKKRIEHDKLNQWTSQVTTGVHQYTELINKTKESTWLLMDELHRRKGIYGDIIPTPLTVSKNYTAELKPLKKETKSVDFARLLKTIFSVCVILFMLGVLIWLIRELIRLKLI